MIFSKQKLSFRQQQMNANLPSASLFKQLCPEGQDKIPFKFLLHLLRKNGFIAKINDLRMMKPDCRVDHFTKQEFEASFTDPQANQQAKIVVERTNQMTDTMFKATNFSSLMHHISYLYRRDVSLNKIKDADNQIVEKYDQYMGLIKSSNQEWCQNDNSVSGYTLPSLIPSQFKEVQQLKKYEVNRSKCKKLPEGYLFPTSKEMAKDKLVDTEIELESLIQAAKAKGLSQTEASINDLLNSPQRSSYHEIVKGSFRYKPSFISSQGDMGDDESLPITMNREPHLKLPFHKKKMLSPPRSQLVNLASFQLKDMVNHKSKFEDDMRELNLKARKTHYKQRSLIPKVDRSIKSSTTVQTSRSPNIK